MENNRIAEGMQAVQTLQMIQARQNTMFRYSNATVPRGTDQSIVQVEVRQVT